MGAWDVVQDVQRPKSKPKEPDSLSFDQAKALVGAIQTDEERALVYVYLSQGLRLREALGLNIEDVQEDRLRVRGKTASQFIPLLSEVREALLRLCRNRQPNEPVFISSRGKPISTTYSESLIAKIFKRAGISGIKASPHTLRHTFATLLTRAGCDSVSCKRLLRHRDFDITSHYIHLTFDDLTNKLVQFSPLAIIFGKLGISSKNAVTLR
jgi:site-specific recombinase XerD